MLNAASDGHAAQARLLLIEDNEGDIFLLSMALKRASFSYSLTTIRDGAEAVTYLMKCGNPGAAPPDLILLDLNLPRVDGTSIIGLLRGEPALENIPVIVLSSSKSPQDAKRAGGLRRSIFIAKPSELQAFRAIGEKVKDFLQQSRQTESISNAKS
jgi:CheY-like chemotaxis protein